MNKEKKVFLVNCIIGFVTITTSYCVIVMVSDQQPNRINELNICQQEASGLIKGTAGVYLCVYFCSFFFHGGQYIELSERPLYYQRQLSMVKKIIIPSLAHRKKTSEENK